MNAPANASTSVLLSEKSDSSDLAVLNAAMDSNIHNPSVLSNSSDFELLVNATCQAEMRNHREVPVIASSSSDCSSHSSGSAEQMPVVSKKRKGESLSTPSKAQKTQPNLDELCTALEQKSISAVAKKSLNKVNVSSSLAEPDAANVPFN